MTGGTKTGGHRSVYKFVFNRIILMAGIADRILVVHRFTGSIPGMAFTACSLFVGWVQVPGGGHRVHGILLAVHRISGFCEPEQTVLPFFFRHTVKEKA